MSGHHVERAAELALPAAKKLVLMALCDSADKDTRVGLPGFDMLMRWSNLGKSQTHAVIQELIAEGYVTRTKPGRKGQRAEYRVFDLVACCADHGPYRMAPPTINDDPIAPESSGARPEAESGQPDPIRPREPVDNSPEIGSGQPDSTPHRVRLGSGKGSGKGSGLDRTPSHLPTFPEGDAGARNRTRPAPQPVDNDPLRCRTHQGVDHPPPCGACGERRRAEQARQTQAETELARRQAQQRHDEAVAATQARLAAIAACDTCDSQGRLDTGQLCPHDLAHRRSSTRRGVAAARSALRRPPDPADPEKETPAA